MSSQQERRNEMVVETYCDRCGMKYDWAGVTAGDHIYCCAGCANGGPCTCPRTAADTVTVTDDPVVVADDDTIVVT
jgi:hypothetical protein